MLSIVNTIRIQKKKLGGIGLQKKKNKKFGDEGESSEYENTQELQILKEKKKGNAHLPPFPAEPTGSNNINVGIPSSNPLRNITDEIHFSKKSPKKSPLKKSLCQNGNNFSILICL